MIIRRHNYPCSDRSGRWFEVELKYLLHFLPPEFADTVKLGFAPVQDGQGLAMRTSVNSLGNQQ